MTKVVVIGERGEVMQSVRVGPAVLERVQTWDDLPRLASVADAAGFETTAWDPRESVDGLPEPDCWILSDMPLAAAVAIGLYQRMTDRAATAGLLMLGGALSFSGQQGVGGWAAANGHRMWPVSIDVQDDAVEAPGGLAITPTADCPRDLAHSLAGAPRVFGYNRVAAAPGASTLATFPDGAVAVAAGGKGDRRSAVYTSDFMPHWGAETASWEGLPGLLRALVGLVATT